MKRSEMVKLLAQSIYDCDSQGNALSFWKVEADGILTILEQAGMLPPKRDPADSGDFNDLKAWFKGETSNTWEPEDET